MSKKQYWVRFVYTDHACEESDYLSSSDACRLLIQKRLGVDPFARFAYIMTYDAYGECFVDLIRREAA